MVVSDDARVVVVVEEEEVRARRLGEGRCSSNDMRGSSWLVRGKELARNRSGGLQLHGPPNRDPFHIRKFMSPYCWR